MSGVEIIGLLLAIPPAIVQLKKAVQLVRAQHKAFVENHTNIVRVASRYGDLAEYIPHFRQEIEAYTSFIPPSALALVRHELGVCTQLIERASSQLRDIARKDVSRNRLVKFFRCKHVKDTWEELEQAAEQLMPSFRHMSLTCTVVANFSRMREQSMVHESENIVQHSIQSPQQNLGFNYTSHSPVDMGLNTLIQTASAATYRSFRDIDMNFTCAILCPKNPPYVIAEFDEPDSPGSQLLTSILRETSNSVPDIYGSRKIELIGNCGGGQTCILRSLCNHQDIVSRFIGEGKGGIYYIKLGSNFNADDVRRKLAEIAECAGGRHLKETILTENISIGIAVLVHFFKHKDTLFLVDAANTDVSIVNTAFRARVLEQLVSLSTTSTSSAVVFSCRLSDLRLGEVIEVHLESESVSRSILLRSAEVDRMEVNVTSNEAINRIIGMLRGNKRLLELAGVCHKHLSEEESKDTAWQMLAENLRQRLGNKAGEDEVQDVLITELLHALQMGVKELLQTAPSIHQLYRALPMAGRREWIPLSELNEVWKLDSQDCDIVTGLLLRGNLCRISERVVEGVMTKGMEIDDCLWEYMRREARKCGRATVTA